MLGPLSGLPTQCTCIPSSLCCVSNKVNYTRGKKFLKKTSFRVGMELQKVQKQGRDEKLKNTTLLRNNVSLLSGLQRNALASLVCFVTYTTKQTRDASALRWRPERRLTLFRSRVVFLSFSSLPCFCTFYLCTSFFLCSLGYAGSSSFIYSFDAPAWYLQSDWRNRKFYGKLFLFHHEGKTVDINNVIAKHKER